MKVVLGVTGSISAYKACELVRLFVKNNDDVKVVMTESAAKFVTPLTFRTLSRNEVHTQMFPDTEEWIPAHIGLASEADVLLIAPATANIIAKIAHGFADDLLSGIALATRAQIVIAPAMNTNMWTNVATQENVAILKKRGVKFIETGSGELACGTSGDGRFAEPEAVFNTVKNLL